MLLLLRQIRCSLISMVVGAVVAPLATPGQDNSLSSVNQVNASDAIITPGGNTFCSRAGTALSCVTPAGQDGSITITGYVRKQGSKLGGLLDMCQQFPGRHGCEHSGRSQQFGHHHLGRRSEPGSDQCDLYNSGFGLFAIANRVWLNFAQPPLPGAVFFYPPTNGQKPLLKGRRFPAISDNFCQN